MSTQSSTAPIPTPDTHDREESSKRQRTAAVLHLLDEWLADESGYDEETRDGLKAAMKESRRTSRSPSRD